MARVAEIAEGNLNARAAGAAQGGAQHPDMPSPYFLHTDNYTDAIAINFARIIKIQNISINCIDRSATISLYKISVDKSTHGIIC